MSDYRIGIVVEGTTDRLVIESALNKIFAEHTYTLTQLQPELSDGGCLRLAEFERTTPRTIRDVYSFKMHRSLGSGCPLWTNRSKSLS